MTTSFKQVESENGEFSVKSIKSAVLDSPPSCIEFAPGLPEYFIVGTYYLEPDGGESEEAVQARSGSLMLFCLQGSGYTLYDFPLSW